MPAIITPVLDPTRRRVECGDCNQSVIVTAKQADDWATRHNNRNHRDERAEVTGL